DTGGCRHARVARGLPGPARRRRRPATVGRTHDVSGANRLLQATKRQAHLALLRLYRRFPPGARRRLVRLVAPSFTVGAICVIERRDGAILLIRHAYRDRWGLPGGLLNRAESPADAARREVVEEIGVPVELLGEAVPVVD